MEERTGERNINSFEDIIDSIHLEKLELETLMAILHLGSNQIIKENRISFTIVQICKLLRQPKTQYTYQQIRTAIFQLKINPHTVKLSEYYERSFRVISAMEIPRTDNGFEKEWTIEIDRVLREQILQYYFSAIFADEEVASFSSELSQILFYMLVIEKNDRPHIKTKVYTLLDIIEECHLNGKPSVLKRKINKSLKEIKEMKNSIIKEFISKEENSVFEIHFNDFPLGFKDNIDLL